MANENLWEEIYTVSVPVKKAPKKPPVAVRVLMQLLSVVLCLCLVCAVISTTLVFDLRYAVTKEGITQMVMTMLEGDDPQQTTAFKEAVMDAVVDAAVPVEGAVSEIAKVPLRTMLEESTVMDFVVEKAAGYVSDYISGETNTQITAEDLVQQLELNKDLFKVYLGVEMDSETLTKIADAAEALDIDSVIRREVLGALGVAEETRDVQEEEAFQDPGSLDAMEIVENLRQATSDRTMYYVLGLCLAIAVMLLLGNYYSIPGGLGWIAAGVIVAGALLSAPVYLTLANPEAIGTLMDGQMMIVDVLVGIFASLAPIHYTVLGIGLAIAALSVMARIIRAFIRKKKYA